MQNMKEFEARQAIISTCIEMNRSGINQGTSGNISLRWKDGLLITPSGIPYDIITPDDIIYMLMDGSYQHPLNPSSEWRFHRDILRARPDAGAVVHAHPIYATAFAMCQREVPAVHYMIAAAGGPNIRCATYASFGTEELSKAALIALTDRNCCLLANHGMIATGPILSKAMWLAIELETLCHQYAIALQIGAPIVLSDEEISLNIEKFKTYGPRASQEPG